MDSFEDSNRHLGFLRGWQLTERWVTLGVSRSTLFYPTGITDGYQVTVLSITTVRISHLTRTLFIVWLVFKRHPKYCEDLLQSFTLYLVLEVNITWCTVRARFHYGNFTDNFKT